jgi:hypothetical protein
MAPSERPQESSEIRLIVSGSSGLMRSRRSRISALRAAMSVPALNSRLRRTPQPPLPTWIFCRPRRPAICCSTGRMTSRSTSSGLVRARSRRTATRAVPEAGRNASGS